MSRTLSGHPFVKELLELLTKHEAVIQGTCQSGCYLEIRIGRKRVEEFCVSIPEMDARGRVKEEYDFPEDR